MGGIWDLAAFSEVPIKSERLQSLLLFMIEVGGCNRQDPTAAQSEESGCQLSFAWSDESEEMKAGVRIKEAVVSSFPDSLITEKKLCDHGANWSVHFVLKFYIVYIK